MSNAVVAIAGSSGLIGTALVYALRATDNRVLRIVRRAPSNADELFWNPDAGEFDAGALRGVDAAVNLCGDVEDRFEINVDPTMVFDYPTVSDIAAFIWAETEAGK